MAIESACIPLPSEIIMPFSGYLVSRGEMNLWLVGIAGAFGCVVGSIAAYYVGMYGGRPFIEKYGRYILLSHHDLDIADRWFAKYGEAIVFISRLLPAIRTFIAFPAGGAHEHDAFHHLHVRRFVAVVFRTRLHRSEARREVGQGRHAQDLVSPIRFCDRNCGSGGCHVVDLAPHQTLKIEACRHRFRR